MRVVQLVAGAGGMYCGSCMRDNRLAAALLAQGRDVLLLPLYTPIRTDEPDVSVPEVYYGGISVFLRQKYSLFRRMPGFVDHLLNLPALLRAAARMAVRTSPHDFGALTVSVLQGYVGGQRKELGELCDALREIQPDLIHLPNLMFVGIAGALKSELKVRIVCSLAGEDIFLDALPEPFRGRSFALIRAGAAAVDGFIAPTQYYRTHAVAHFGLPTDFVHFVPMGIRLDDYDEPADLSGPPTIGYLARICPEKGLAVLAEAFALLRASGRPCRLRSAGYLGAADRPYLQQVRKNLQNAGCEDSFEYVGEVTREEKRTFLKSVHMASVPTVYHEAKGFYLLEALAAGVPVVQPRHGSFPELIEATNGGLLYDPGDPQALADSLARLMDDDALRRRLGEQGRNAVRSDFTDALMAERTWTIYEKL